MNIKKNSLLFPEEKRGEGTILKCADLSVLH
jgi:hypothetical protein